MVLRIGGTDDRKPAMEALPGAPNAADGVA